MLYPKFNFQGASMSDQDNDDTRRVGLWVVFTVVGLVVAAVIGFATVRTLSGAAAPTVQREDVGEAAAEEVALMGEPALRLYFELGQASLSPEAVAALAAVAERARSSGDTVYISGFHDASGSAAANAELAKQRALAVHHALEADGVPPAQLVLRKPALTLGDGDPREARRVELHLQ
jgi:outer membrane protein OmpA-like peptidoglycan-associated protein